VSEKSCECDGLSVHSGAVVVASNVVVSCWDTEEMVSFAVAVVIEEEEEVLVICWVMSVKQ
jgi:hypothetical protein